MRGSWPQPCTHAWLAFGELVAGDPGASDMNLELPGKRSYAEEAGSVPSTVAHEAVDATCCEHW